MSYLYNRKGLNRRLFLYLSGWLFCSLAWAAGGEYVEETPSGTIYWSKGLVVAEGKGVTSLNTVNLALSKAMAEKAAIKDARNNLMEVIKIVRLDSAHTVGTLMVQNDKYKEEITALVQKAPPMDIKYKPDSTVEVWVGLKLYGPMADFYIHQVLANPPKSEIPKEEPAKKESKFIVSGVIIDARGLGVKPAFAPKLYDESGKEVWGASQMFRNAIASHGVVMYTKELALAKTHPRAGDTPYVAKAVKALGPEKVDLVLSRTDIQALTSASETQSFFALGRVLILSD